jgi:hypothetical protein
MFGLNNHNILLHRHKPTVATLLQAHPTRWDNNSMWTV